MGRLGAKKKTSTSKVTSQKGRGRIVVRNTSKFNLEQLNRMWPGERPLRLCCVGGPVPATYRNGLNDTRGGVGDCSVNPFCRMESTLDVTSGMQPKNNASSHFFVALNTSDFRSSFRSATSRAIATSPFRRYTLTVVKSGDQGSYGEQARPARLGRKAIARLKSATNLRPA